jgi:hypothetical protein
MSGIARPFHEVSALHYVTLDYFDMLSMLISAISNRND